MPTMRISRAQWGAAPAAKHATRNDLRFVTGLAVHHSGTPQDRQQDHDHCGSRVHAIQREHQGGKGWSDIAYHWITCQHGAIFDGRDWAVRCAANGSNWANTRFMAVCVLGDWRQLTLPVSLVLALDDVRRDLLAHVPSALSVRPHASFVPTACPGPALTKYASARDGRSPRA